MNNDVFNYVASRCQHALEDNERYENCKDEDLKEAIAEEECYIRGFYDCLEICSQINKKCSQNL